MFEIQCGKKQQDERVCMGNFWIWGSIKEKGASSPFRLSPTICLEISLILSSPASEMLKI